MALSAIPSASLPELYSRWLRELFPGPIPAETHATCDACVMLPSAGQILTQTPDARTFYFNPSTKCCTYVPQLHNFLVGQILLDDDPAFAPGRSSVESRLAARLGISPLGLAPPSSYSLQYEHGTLAFGRSRAMRCPHYLDEGGRCGVWKYRESTCCTWFCKYVRGAVGQNFWREALHPLLQTVEHQLAMWCLVELEFDAEPLEALLDASARSDAADPLKPEELDGRVEPAEYARLWGRWRGREADLYRECARLVSPLSWAQVLAIGGAEVQARARVATRAHARLMDSSIPARLAAGSVQLVQIGPEITRVASYSNELDPLDVPTPLLFALRYFDGRLTQDALREIKQNEGITLQEDLVRKLVDFSVLVSPGLSGIHSGED